MTTNRAASPYTLVPAADAAYPRRGQAVVPRLLAGMLNGALPASVIDPASASRLSRAARRALGARAVAWLRAALKKLPPLVAAHPLPDPRTLLASTLLDTRTRNVLLRSLPPAGDRTPWTVERYLDIPSFGARGLLDALTSLETSASASASVAPGAAGSSGGLDGALPRIEAVQRRHRREDLRPAPRRLAPVPFADAATIEGAMAVVAADLPLSEEDAAARLAKARLAPAGVELARLLVAASRMGMKPPFMLLAQGGARLAIRRTDVPLATTAYAIAVRMTYNAGAATVAAIASRLAAVMETEVAPAFLISVLSAVRGFAWLDRPAGWFWFRDRPSRLKEALAKLFAAVTRLPIATLRDALWKGVDAALRPPPAAIEALGLTLPGARIEAGALVIPRRLDRSVYLSDGERALVERLERAGRPLSVQDLRDATAPRPLSTAAVLRLVRSSPLFELLPPGDLCGLVGAGLEEAARTLSA